MTSDDWNGFNPDAPLPKRVPKKVLLPETTESLTEAVYQAIGEASVVCWETVGKGVFQEQNARDVAERLLAKIREITEYDQPKLGMATDNDLIEELATRAHIEAITGQGHEEWTPHAPMWHIVEEPWVGKETLWQHRDNSNVFSTDRGETYYNLTEPLDDEGNPVIHKIGDQIA